MVSLISDSGLIGLQSLNARSGIVGGNLLQTENSPRFANQQTSSGRSTLDSVGSNLGNIAGIRAAKNGLTVTDTALASAVTAAEGIRETVLELGAIAVQAEADNIDEQTRNNLIERFETLRERLEGQVDQATVGDVNLIAEGAGNLTVTTSEGEEIKVEAQDLSAQGLGISQISVTLPTEAKATDTVLKKALTTLDTRVDELEKSAAAVGSALDSAKTATGHMPTGVAELIDPDITAQDAELKAIDIRQRLGEEILAIANVDGFSFVGLVRQDSAGIQQAKAAGSSATAASSSEGSSGS